MTEFDRQMDIRDAAVAILVATVALLACGAGLDLGWLWLTIPSGFVAGFCILAFIGWLVR